MKLVHILYGIVIIAHRSKECYSLSVNISNGINKKPEEHVKQALMKIEKLEKEV